jgi:hypothetical protein
MNPADLHDVIVSTFRLIDHVLTVGVFIALGALAITLAVREVGSALRVRVL